MSKGLCEFTEDELEWIHIAIDVFEELSLPAFDGNKNKAKKDFHEIRRKVRKQVYKIRNP